LLVSSQDNVQEARTHTIRQLSERGSRRRGGRGISSPTPRDQLIRGQETRDLDRRKRRASYRPGFPHLGPPALSRAEKRCFLRPPLSIIISVRHEGAELRVIRPYMVIMTISASWKWDEGASSSQQFQHVLPSLSTTTSLLCGSPAHPLLRGEHETATAP
jgi:hypothetical protein